jgi:hypothetical protein
VQPIGDEQTTGQQLSGQLLESFFILVGLGRFWKSVVGNQDTPDITALQVLTE